MDGFQAIDLGFLVMLGLTGSFHCAGMCGAICSTYAIPVQANRRASLWKYHFFYLAGRLFAYAWIGGMLGTLGMSFYMTASPDSYIRDIGAIIAGILLVVGGASSSFGQKWPERFAVLVTKVMRILFPSLQQWSKGPGAWRVAPLGMISGILPCGLMWAVEMRAFASNSLLWGMVTMVIFCLVTSPAVLLTGTLLSKVSPLFRVRSMQLAGLLIVAMGARLIWNHFFVNDLWKLCIPEF